MLSKKMLGLANNKNKIAPNSSIAFYNSPGALIIGGRGLSVFITLIKNRHVYHYLAFS